MRRHNQPEREELCCRRCVHGAGTTKQGKRHDKFAKALQDVKCNWNDKPEKRKDPGASPRRGPGGELVGRSRSKTMLQMKRSRPREFENGTVWDIGGGPRLLWIGLPGTRWPWDPFALLGFSLRCKSSFSRTTSFSASQAWDWQCLRRFTFHDFDIRS